MILRDHVRRKRAGEGVVAPVDCILENITVVQPDIVFVETARRSIMSERGIEGAPTLVVEVVSPSTGAIDRRRKLQLYARYAVPNYWIVDPPARTIEAHALAHGRYEEAGVLRGRASVAPALWRLDALSGRDLAHGVSVAHSSTRSGPGDVGRQGASADPIMTPTMPPQRFRVAVDIGGTFTDIVFLDADGRLHTKKVSSSVDDYARAIVDGLREVFDETGLTGSRRDRGAARHHRRLQRDPGAEGRAHGAHHHARVPRRARDPAPAHAAPVRPHVGEAAHAGRAPPAAGGGRAHRRPRRGAAAARRRRGRAALDTAARAGRSRRSPSACSTPAPTPSTRSGSRRSSSGARPGCRSASAARCCRRSGSTSARRPR